LGDDEIRRFTSDILAMYLVLTNASFTNHAVNDRLVFLQSEGRRQGVMRSAKWR
jgi:hypothetical protein